MGQRIPLLHHLQLVVQRLLHEVRIRPHLRPRGAHGVNQLRLAAHQLKTLRVVCLDVVRQVAGALVTRDVRDHTRRHGRLRWFRLDHDGRLGRGGHNHRLGLHDWDGLYDWDGLHDRNALHNRNRLHSWNSPASRHQERPHELIGLRRNLLTHHRIARQMQHKQLVRLGPPLPRSVAREPDQQLQGPLQRDQRLRALPLPPELVVTHGRTELAHHLPRQVAPRVHRIVWLLARNRHDQVSDRQVRHPAVQHDTAHTLRLRRDVRERDQLQDRATEHG